MRENHEEITEFRKMKFNSHQVKQLFPEVIEQDINEIVDLLNIKLREWQQKVIVFDVHTLEKPSVEDAMKKISEYVSELSVEYDTTGLATKYKKIQKVLDILDNDDDLKIVEEIKKEYIETKIL